MPEFHTVTVEKLVFGGSALARLRDGRAVLVPGVLPEEQVAIRLREGQGKQPKVELVEVLQTSPRRIEPLCPHFGLCGGCQYQHMTYADQLAAKQGILAEQLVRIGKLPAPPVRPIVASPAEWNYRNHLQFHLTEAGMPGFVDSTGRAVFALKECHLPESHLDSAWQGMSFDPGAPLERISLRLGVEASLLLLLESRSPELPQMELEVGMSVVHKYADSLLVLAGEAALLMGVLDRTFQVSAASFFQVNTLMAEKMVQHLQECLQIPPGGTLLDVYCGVGLFSLFFAPSLSHLVGVEVSPSACEDFAANLDEYDHVDLYQAGAHQVLPHLDFKPGSVIVDPPRTGLDRRSLDALLRLASPRLAYVSCHPATLARDAALLIQGGYKLEQVTPFDLFPQTSHIESISLFSRD